MIKQTIKIALLGYSNLDLLTIDLEAVLSRFMPMYQFEIYSIPYGQLRSMIFDPTSELYAFSPNIAWFCTWCDDFFDPIFDMNVNLSAIQESYHQYLSSVKHFLERINIPVYINEPTGLVRLEAVYNTKSIQATLRDCFDSFILSQPYLVVLNYDDIILHGAVVDTRLKFIGRIPFSSDFSSRIAEKFCGHLARYLGRSIRLIVVDLDNTLWGGILGEEGITGICIGGDYPGNCYSAFQQALLSLRRQGILLALVSKNDLSIVQEVFKKREMPLKMDDFMAVEANWNNKIESIDRIIKQVGFDQSNILFIDDSMIECQLVINRFPRLHVIHLPDDPVDYFYTLENMPLLMGRKDGHKDEIDRTSSYKIRREYITQTDKINHVNDFFRTLNLTIFFDNIHEGNVVRCAELLSKTTQFNLTGNRYSENQLLELVKHAHIVLAISVEDVYSKKEVMGVIIIKKRPGMRNFIIDNYVISCRALGKSVESEALKAILIQLYPDSLHGEINPTPRNIPAQDIFNQLGFTLINGIGKWEFSSPGSMVVSDWVNIVNLNTVFKKENKIEN